MNFSEVKKEHEKDIAKYNDMQKKLEIFLDKEIVSAIFNIILFENKNYFEIKEQYMTQRCLSCCTLEDFENMSKDEEIKKGCEGAVFKVKCSLENEMVKDRIFALKGIFNYYSGTYSVIRNNFISEYQILCTILPHRNIVNVWGTFVDNASSPSFKIPSDVQLAKALFIIMDYHDMNLEQHLQNVKLNEQILEKMVLDLLNGLNHINNYYIAHRDLKLNNILVDNEDQRLIIADFGMAKRFDKSFKLKVDDNVQGNENHRAPEILNNNKKNKDIDYQLADMWALGVLIYEICGIQKPFEKINKRNEYDTKSLPEITLSKRITHLVYKMLEFDISKRINFKAAISFLKNDKK